MSDTIGTVPTKRHQWKRLADAMYWSRHRLEPFRKHRYKAIEQLVGFHYSDDGAKTTVPVNLVEMALNIFVRHLAPPEMRTLITTQYRGLKPMASDFELGTNHLIQEIQLGKTLRRIAQEAMLSTWGMAKIGLERVHQVEVRGFYHDVGQPFVDLVDLDDWVHDMSSKVWEQVGYAGNQYDLPLEVAREVDAWDKSVREGLQSNYQTAYNEQGDPKAETISRGNEGHEREFKDYTTVWDIWLPLENKLITLPADDDGGLRLEAKPLRVIDWDGPEGGPYRYLHFNDVPSNIMPLAPAAQWMDLHMLINVVWRKLGRQAERQKDVLVVPPASGDDAQRLQRSSDGEYIRQDVPNSVNEFKYGGPDQQNLAFSIMVKDLFVYMGGNLDALGGLGPQSETLGQDQLLSASASKRVADMQQRMLEFTTEIVRDLAWYLWTDPLIDLTLVKRIPGVDLDIPTSFTAEQREGDFLDYNIQIDPYSMQHQTPQTQLQTLVQMFREFVMPAAPLMAEQGIQIDWEMFLRTMAKYTNMTELEDMILFLESEQSGYNANGQGPVIPRPAQTVRRHERVNIPGASRHGKDAALIQTLLGGGQPDSAASISRPTSAR